MWVTIFRAKDRVILRHKWFKGSVCAYDYAHDFIRQNPGTDWRIDEGDEFSDEGELVREDWKVDGASNSRVLGTKKDSV